MLLTFFSIALRYLIGSLLIFAIVATILFYFAKSDNLSGRLLEYILNIGSKIDGKIISSCVILSMILWLSYGTYRIVVHPLKHEKISQLLTSYVTNSNFALLTDLTGVPIHLRQQIESLFYKDRFIQLSGGHLGNSVADNPEIHRQQNLNVLSHLNSTLSVPHYDSFLERLYIAGQMVENLRLIHDSDVSPKFADKIRQVQDFINGLWLEVFTEQLRFEGIQENSDIWPLLSETSRIFEFQEDEFNTAKNLLNTQYKNYKLQSNQNENPPVFKETESADLQITSFINESNFMNQWDKDLKWIIKEVKSFGTSILKSFPQDLNENFILARQEFNRSAIIQAIMLFASILASLVTISAYFICRTQQGRARS